MRLQFNLTMYEVRLLKLLREFPTCDLKSVLDVVARRLNKSRVARGKLAKRKSS